MPIRGIIFDFDGTLLDSMGYWANASYQIMTENGVADPEAAFAVSEKHPLFDACQIWHDRFGARQQGPQMFERISAVMKDNYAHRIKPYPGERDFLDSLRAAGVRLCVATSSVPAAVREALAANDLDGYFDFVLGTDEVGRGKEFPDVYLEASRRLGTSTEDTWVFEDAPFGLRAAKRAGFHTVCIFNGRDGRDEGLCRAWSDIFSHEYIGMTLDLLQDYADAPDDAAGVLNVIVVDGSPEPSSSKLVAHLAGRADYVVVADRGAEVLHEAGVIPDVYCGDADSVSTEAHEWALAAATRHIGYPSEKYATDLAIAIDCAKHEAARQGRGLALTLTCASGGRTDHALAVLGQLARNADAAPREVEDDFECRILSPCDGGCQSWALGETAVGKTLSVIAVAPGSVVSEVGMQWNLDQASLPLLDDTGVSNVVKAPDAKVTAHAGAVAVFLNTRQ